MHAGRQMNRLLTDANRLIFVTFHCTHAKRVLQPSCCSTYAGIKSSNSHILPVWQRNTFDRIVTIINLILSFKHDSKTTLPEAMNRTEVCQEAWGKLRWLLSTWIWMAPVCVWWFWLWKHCHWFLHNNDFLANKWKCWGHHEVHYNRT
jgi:hypothetical protein